MKARLTVGGAATFVLPGGNQLHGGRGKGNARRIYMGSDTGDVLRRVTR